MRLFLYYRQMTNYILFDDDSWEQLLPLSFTRPVCELRVGILTLRKKWEVRLNAKLSHITQDYLADKYPLHIGQDNVIINGSLLANDFIAKLIMELDPNDALLYQGDLLAARISKTQFEKLFKKDQIDQLNGIELNDTPIVKINRLTDLFQLNDMAIREDFELLTKDPDKKSAIANNTCNISAARQIYIHPTAKVKYCTLNAENGPIYIGPKAEIMEGAMIRGPVALCQAAQVKMGATIYGATTIGPYCKVGGEVKNVIFHSYSNKAHQGYLGDAYIGQWCNLGANTNASNLKNNYSPIRLWSYPDNAYINTQEQFCGLLMADHSKSGINTMFNTGTVVGVGANIFGADYPPKFIPSFSWGGAKKLQTQLLDKMLETAQRVTQRRKIDWTNQDQQIIKHIFEQTAKYRHWEIQ